MGIPITPPPANAISRQVVTQAVNEIVNTGHKIKTYVDNTVPVLQSSNTAANDIFEKILQPAAKQSAHLTDLAATPELDNVARQIIPGYAGSLSNDAMATVAAINGVTSWITTNIPKDASGYVLVYKWNVDGTQVARSFTPAQTTGLVTVLNAVGATIG